MTDFAVKGILFFTEKSGLQNDILIQKSREALSAAFPDALFYSNSSEISSRTVSGTLIECLTSVSKDACSDDRDAILLFRGISPFFDFAVFKEAYQKHQRYLSHYTFSENIPEGFLPDIVSSEWIQLIPEEKKANIQKFSDLRAFLLKHIDDWDVEIFYKSPDLRQYRLDFSCETSRSENLVLSILEKQPELSFDNLQDFLLKNSSVMRPCPSYMEISLTDRSPVDPEFLPRKKEKQDMSDAHLEQIFSEIRTHPLKEDLTVSLSGTGEPLLHAKVLSAIEEILSCDSVKLLYLETYGASFSKDFYEFAEQLKNPERFHVIVRLTTLDPRRYAKLYGADLLDQVLQGMEELKQCNPKIKLYSEMIKMTDVSDETELYFSRFENSGIIPLLSKFNRYIDLLEERRVSDLTPLHRDFCWHLARDIFITPGGKIPLCRQDIFAEKEVQTVEGGIYSAFENHFPAFENSILSRHEHISMPCLSCDEWYTFLG